MPERREIPVQDLTQEGFAPYGMFALFKQPGRGTALEFDGGVFIPDLLVTAFPDQ